MRRITKKSVVQKPKEMATPRKYDSESSASPSDRPWLHPRMLYMCKSPGPECGSDALNYWLLELLVSDQNCDKERRGIEARSA